MNKGKRFEQNFKNSVPENIFIYRFKDGSSSWGGNDKVRFQPSNICDYLMFNGRYLYLLELKSTKGKSLPLNNIKQHQIDDLINANLYKNIVCGFLIQFSDLEAVYFVEISQFKTFLDINDRKSVPVSFCEKYGIKIDSVKLKTNYKYDVKKMIEDIEKEVTS